jgi:hypothetical protein
MLQAGPASTSPKDRLACLLRKQNFLPVALYNRTDEYQIKRIGQETKHPDHPMMSDLVAKKAIEESTKRRDA